MTAPSTISRWFNQGKKQGATHMIVVCDTFDHEDYPVYVMPEEDANEKTEKFREMEMQRVMEVYNLFLDKDKQLQETRAFHF
ncbi:MAG: hypothetical protein Q7S53_05745 [bacterium]|nr:hypothetical protein [bacterium]